MRIHHTLANGISLARVLLSLMDESTEQHFTPEPSAREAPPAPSWMKLLRGARAVASGTRAALKRSAELIAEPIQVGDLVREGARGAATLKRLALLPSDPPTVL